MFRQYPLFQSHLDLAHSYWEKLIQSGDTVIDATCGNGHDTLFIAKLALKLDSAKVLAFDVQASAIEKSRILVENQFTPEQLTRIQFVHRCHSTFPMDLCPESVRVIVYNLGYLPGGDKKLTTCVDTTLMSIKAGLKLLCPGGILSITCYPGHPQGLIEEKSLLSYCSNLEAKEWSCCHHRWLNRCSSPSLLVIQRCG